MKWTDEGRSILFLYLVACSFTARPDSLQHPMEHLHWVTQTLQLLQTSSMMENECRQKWKRKTFSRPFSYLPPPLLRFSLDLQAGCLLFLWLPLTGISNLACSSSPEIFCSRNGIVYPKKASIFWFCMCNTKHTAYVHFLRSVLMNLCLHFALSDLIQNLFYSIPKTGPAQS